MSSHHLIADFKTRTFAGANFYEILKQQMLQVRQRYIVLVYIACAGRARVFSLHRTFEEAQAALQELSNRNLVSEIYDIVNDY